MGAAFEIFGAKGGGKGGGGGSIRTPVEHANTLQNNTTAHLTEILSEGEIGGFANGLQSVYMDGVPVQNPDGSMNYPGVTIQERVGLPDQPPVEGLRELGREVNFSRKVTKKDGPVIFTVEDPDADGILVKIRIPALYMQEATDQNTLGDVKPYNVSFSIAQKGQGGVWEDARVASGWVACGTTTEPWTRQIKAVVAAQTPVANFVRVSKPGRPAVYEWQHKSKTVTAFYRMVGAEDWKMLGTAVLTSTLQQEKSSEGGYTTVSRTVNKSLSWSAENLIEGQYELRCEEGSFSSISCYTYTPIIFNDKCTSPYEAQFRVELTPGAHPWQIKVERVSPDAEKSNIQNETWVSGYTVCYYNKFTFPNTAYVHITVDTAQFGTSVPTRDYDIYGLIVNVPSNYDPKTREYSGIWDGSFKRAWTDNPAWVFYDLLTNTRYGMGRIVSKSSVDVGSLYKVAMYCDELVPDGYGDMEPRYTFNGVINVEKPAVTWLQEVATNSRSMIYQANGNIVLWQDRPEPPSRILTPENIIGGDIEYQGTAKTARYSQVAVTWNDPEDGYRPCPEIAEDQEMMRLYGIIKQSIPGVGITSRGQARRFAEWVLYTNKHETQVASLATGLDCHDVRPGKVLALYDSARAGLKTGGKIKEPGMKTLTLDTPFHFNHDHHYWLSVTMPDGTMEEKAVVNVGVCTDIVTLESPLGQMPLRGAVWGIKAINQLEPQHLRVMGVKEDGNKYGIVGPIISRSKWDAIEKGWAFDDPPISNIPTGPLVPPIDITAIEYLYRSGSSVRSAVAFSWRSEEPRAAAYHVRIKRPGSESFQDHGVTSSMSTEILDTTIGEWVFQVRCSDSIGRVSAWSKEFKIYLFGMYGAPEDVKDFNISVTGQTAMLTWSQISDLDLSHYELRFSRNREATWEQAGILAKMVQGCSCTVPSLNGVYFIKAVDLVGVYSKNGTGVFTDYAGLENINLVETISEVSGQFLGSHMQTRQDQEGLVLTSTDNVLQNWPALKDLNNGVELGVGAWAMHGTYEPVRSVDLGGIYPCRLSAMVGSYGRSRGGHIKDWPALKNMGAISGTNPSQWSVALEYSVSRKKEPVQAEDWTPWAPFVVGDVTARHFKFRVVLGSDSQDVTPVVSKLEAIVDMPDRASKGEDIYCPEDGLTVDFDPPFMKTPSMAFSVQGAPQGMRLPEYTATKDGFTVKLYDKDGQPLALAIDYIAMGYGGCLGEGE